MTFSQPSIKHFQNRHNSINFRLHSLTHASESRKTKDTLKGVHNMSKISWQTEKKHVTPYGVPTPAANNSEIITIISYTHAQNTTAGWGYFCSDSMKEKYQLIRYEIETWQQNYKLYTFLEILLRFLFQSSKYVLYSICKKKKTKHVI